MKFPITFFALGVSLLITDLRADSRDCDLSVFTARELAGANVSVQRFLQGLSPQGAGQLWGMITGYSRIVANSANRLCAIGSERCVGSNESWNFERLLLKDAFGEPLSVTGTMTSREPQVVQGPKFKHQLTDGYTCSQSLDKRVRCTSWCSMIVVGEGSRD